MVSKVLTARTGLTGCSMFLHPVFFALFFLLSLSSAQAASLDAVMQNAQDKNLATHAYWQTLLHYGPGIMGRASLIDDPSFFLSPHGKTDPQVELELTLLSMFDDPGRGEEHTLCRFPARSAWLQSELAIPNEQLPQPECLEYQQMINKVEPTSTELVFPGPHINSPASMFGHTLLTIQGKYASKLLTYAINYAAQTNETNGVFYAFKGIFGLYPGLYSFLPYYTKVREYGDMERRDIWEYRLNLSPAETRRLVDHVWELKDHYSDYFFFGENCSFNLLFLLEVARPGVQLTNQSRRWVIPIETIRQIEKAGLIEQATYRPSKAKRVEKLLTRVSAAGEERAFQLSHSPEVADLMMLGDLSDDPKNLLDLAIEDLDYQYLKQKITQDNYKSRYVTLLSARSKLGLGERLEIQSSAPERGHGSARVGLAFGVSDNISFADFSFRPGYHHLQDPSTGYPSGAQIEYLQPLIRLYKNKKPKLERLDIVNIFSVAPRNLFFPTTSWKVYAGARRQATRHKTRKLVYEINPGGGWAFGTPRLLWYLLGEARIGGGQDFIADLGMSSGVIHQFSGGSNAHLYASWFTDLATDNEQSLEFKFVETTPLRHNLALHLDLSYLRKWHYSTQTAKLGISVYW